MTHTARVVRGKSRGRRIKFPTLNFVPPDSLKAEQGIYAGWVTIGDRRYPAAFHYGPAPTFGEATVSLEAYLLDTVLDTPPLEATFELIHYLRAVQNFSSPETLSDQIAKDVLQTRQKLRL